MDENTIAIVAGNLTLAFYAAQDSQGGARAVLKPGGAPDIDSVVAVYRQFVEKLTPPPGEPGTAEHGPDPWSMA
jgi:hypothetical protein